MVVLGRIADGNPNAIGQIRVPGEIPHQDAAGFRRADQVLRVLRFHQEEVRFAWPHPADARASRQFGEKPLALGLEQADAPSASPIGELTSEDPEFPIESALLPRNESSWRAAAPGEQTIRLIFNSPQRIQRIRLEVIEPSVERTQEFVLRWSADGGKSFREIVRQQWNFNPAGATHQVEDYRVDLPAAAVIELTIIPDTSGGDARASLARLLLA